MGRRVRVSRSGDVAAPARAGERPALRIGALARTVRVAHVPVGRPGARLATGVGRAHRRRRWARRGRRAQVAAVATILGLLLVVTMVANYLTTQLPAAMRVNDADHALAVEDQVTRFASTLDLLAGTDALDALVSQPVSLGSAGEPPFAGPDGASIGPGATGSKLTTAYVVTAGSTSYPETTSGTGGATLVVHLLNTYTPQANVVFDQGAVVYAQPAGIPNVLVGPGLTVSGEKVTLRLPQFTGSLGTLIGAGAAVVSARLVDVLNETVPAGGFAFKSGSAIYLNATTAYAAAWTGYLWSYLNTTLLKGEATVSCSASVSTACSGPFTFNGPLGTVTVKIPAADITSLQIQVATYAITVT